MHVEAGPVILNLELHAIVTGLQGYGNLTGIRVPANVNQGLVINAVKDDLHIPRWPRVGDQFPPGTAADILLQAIQLLFQQGDQAQVLQDRRTELVHDVARLANGLSAQHRGPHGNLTYLGEWPGHRFQGLKLLEYRGQRLRDPVMDLQGQALTLFLLGHDRHLEVGSGALFALHHAIFQHLALHRSEGRRNGLARTP